jgi:hypothetical protein
MKKFGIALLSLGLIAAFSMSAFAVVPEFTGQYYARGSYMSNPSMLPTEGGNSRGPFSYYDQRLRTFFRLKIADGLSLTTRMDSMEVIWGQNTKNYIISGSRGNDANNNQSVSFEQVYTDFKTGIGGFRVGYFSATPYGWATNFMDSTGTNPGIKYTNKFGAFEVLADLYKQDKGNLASTSKIKPMYTQSDADNDLYELGVKTKGKSMEGGLLWSYFRDAQEKAAAAPDAQVTAIHRFQPYYMGKFGPVEIEAEGYYQKGKVNYEPQTSKPADTDITGQGIYVGAQYNMGAAYVGGRFMYASGDDPTTSDKIEGGLNASLGYGRDKAIFGEFNTILFSDDYHDYNVTKGNSVELAGQMDNVFEYQIYGGFKPMPKLELMARFSILKADQDVGTGASKVLSKDYGKELDVKATYNIFDQLTYNVGFAYLWTGDYFKGTSTTQSIENIYYLQHWIELTF